MINSIRCSYIACCPHCNRAVHQIDERTDWSQVTAFIFQWKRQGFTVERKETVLVKSCTCKIEVTSNVRQQRFVL